MFEDLDSLLRRPKRPMQFNETRIGLLQAVPSLAQPPHELSISRRWINESDLLDTSASDPHVNGELGEACPGLTMLCVPRGAWPDSAQRTLKTAKAIEYLQLDQSILQRWSNSSSGWNFFAGSEGRYYFLVHTGLYRLAWSFEPVLMKTNAILLGNEDYDTSQFFNANDIIVASALERKHIYHPMFLARLVLLDTLYYLEERVKEKTQVVHTLDFVTGHGMWAEDDETPATLDATIAASKKIGGAVIRLAHMNRMVEVARSMAVTLENSSIWRRQESKILEEYDRCAISHSEAAPGIKQDIEMIRLTITTLDETAKALSTLIFSVLAREDTRLSNQLAISSMELAEAAKRDSSAMKTIAVMTMVFLPATFFAALFAVPSLRWDQDSIITEKFWIYWAFTLPATLLVFGIWYFMTHCRVLYPSDKASESRSTTFKLGSKRRESFELSTFRTFPVIPGESHRNPALEQMRGRHPPTQQRPY
ncbi:hypothetical protein HD806DRAFT_506326 [Xylariaceae sp. AK1471]|nr:hypothetical protein HD806DRAFT_506326 [Xylariaceae sp. AK1471]